MSIIQSSLSALAGFRSLEIPVGEKGRSCSPARVRLAPLASHQFRDPNRANERKRHTKATSHDEPHMYIEAFETVALKTRFI
jgi:hypothetical protein